MACAVRLASDIPALADLRAGMRTRMLSSPLCDGAAFTAGLEGTYRQLWHRYCREGRRGKERGERGSGGGAARREGAKAASGGQGGGDRVSGSEGVGGGARGSEGERVMPGSGATRTAEGVSEAMKSVASKEAPVESSGKGRPGEGLAEGLTEGVGEGSGEGSGAQQQDEGPCGSSSSGQVKGLGHSDAGSEATSSKKDERERKKK